MSLTKSQLTRSQLYLLLADARGKEARGVVGRRKAKERDDLEIVSRKVVQGVEKLSEAVYSTFLASIQTVLVTPCHTGLLETFVWLEP